MREELRTHAEKWLADPDTPRRMVAALVELVDFSDNLDRTIRTVLSAYCPEQSPVRGPWAAYVRAHNLPEFAKRTMVQGTPAIKALGKRLDYLHRWTHAGLVAWDSTMVSIGSELRAHLLGPNGSGSDPNCKIREYVTRAGQEGFEQHIRECCIQKVASAFTAII